MKLKIALAGNPNCGKTTMFNDLTGSSQYVGNWPGVTVEKKEGKLKGHQDVLIQDLPGIYSLSPYTLEEVVARGYLVNEKPDAIINIIDGTNIERNLYLTTQLLELGIPMVIAINMIDVVRKRGDKINLSELSKGLGCAVVETSALKGIGSKEVAEIAIDLAQKQTMPLLPPFYEKDVEQIIQSIEQLLKEKGITKNLHWFAIKVFEKDEKVLDELNLQADVLEAIRQLIQPCEVEYDDECESIITSQRYAFITQLTSQSIKKKNTSLLSTSDKIDQFVTNRWLALPFFALVMFLVYYISITTVGAFVTDWTNDVLFGEIILPNVGMFLETMNVAPWLVGLIATGIIGGVGAVLGFVPQMIILFFMLSILEDCGYMSRVAFIMDRIFRKFGLSGKSFIPMLIGSGCSVPGIMASRTIERERDRKMTIMTTSFIPCGAKMPIIALIAGALFGGAWWVAPLAYFIGVGAIIISGIMLKKMKVFAGDPSPFVMELPSYHIPTAKNVMNTTWERGFSFIKRAGTVILLSSVVLWFLQAFAIENGALIMVEDNNVSLLATIGQWISPLFAPLGFGNWQAAVGTFTGLIAKENVVGTFGLLYGFGEISENGMEYWALFAKDFTALSAFSFMLFNLLCAPCFAAMGAIKREMNSSKWTLFAIAYLCVFAYSISFIVYQFGLIIQGADMTIFSVIAFVLFVTLIYLLFRKNPHEKTATYNKKVDIANA